MAAVQAGDQAALTAVLGRQRAHLLKELRGLADVRALTAPSADDGLLIAAADLHAPADLGVVVVRSAHFATSNYYVGGCIASHARRLRRWYASFI
jgi:hypothetical protein